MYHHGVILLPTWPVRNGTIFIYVGTRWRPESVARIGPSGRVYTVSATTSLYRQRFTASDMRSLALFLYALARDQQEYVYGVRDAASR